MTIAQRFIPVEVSVDDMLPRCSGHNLCLALGTIFQCGAVHAWSKCHLRSRVLSLFILYQTFFNMRVKQAALRKETEKDKDKK